MREVDFLLRNVQLLSQSSQRTCLSFVSLTSTAPYEEIILGPLLFRNKGHSGSSLLKSLFFIQGEYSVFLVFTSLVFLVLPLVLEGLFLQISVHTSNFFITYVALIQCPTLPQFHRQRSRHPTGLNNLPKQTMTLQAARGIIKIQVWFSPPHLPVLPNLGGPDNRDMLSRCFLDTRGAK